MIFGTEPKSAENFTKKKSSSLGECLVKRFAGIGTGWSGVTRSGGDRLSMR